MRRHEQLLQKLSYVIDTTNTLLCRDDVTGGLTGDLRRIQKNAEATRRDYLDEASAALLDANPETPDSIIAQRLSVIPGNYPNAADSLLKEILRTIRSIPGVNEHQVQNIYRGTVETVFVFDQPELRAVYEETVVMLNNRVRWEVQQDITTVCQCGSALEMDPDQSTNVCVGCGATTRIDGVVFRDEQCYAQNGIKTRNNDYTLMRHYYDWIPRIIGTERIEIPEDHLARIIANLRRREVLATDLDVQEMRKTLKQPDVMLTNYNDNTTTLIKLVGGKGPREPLPEELAVLEAKYRILMHHYHDTVDESHNVKYCPYFIYKLIENFFSNNERMLSMLRFIHLQSEKTVRENDDIYRRIVDKINETNKEDGFVYCATDRNKYQSRFH